MLMLWVLFALSVFVAIGHFLDFLIGERGQRNIKDRLVNYYVSLAEGNWSAALQIVTDKYRHYIEYVFGRRIVSFRFVTRVAIYSGIITVIVCITTTIYFWRVDPILNFARFWEWSRIAIINGALDLVSFILLYVTFRAMSSVTLGRAILLLALGMCFVYLAVSIAVSAAIAVESVGIDTQTGAHLSIYSRFRGILSHVIVNPLNRGWSMFSDGVFGFAVGLPILAYVIVMLGGMIMLISKPVSQRPLLLLCERLEGAKSGVFTTLATAITLIVGIIVAFQKAIG
jgi:hypothetical protein